jgi:ribokinase
LGTGVGLPVVEPGGENSIIIVPRANLGWTAAGVRACAGAIEQADVVLTQFEVPMECVLEVARIGHAAGVTVVVNPAPYAPVPADLLPLVDVLTPNEQELLALAGGGLVDGRAAVTPGVLEAAARAVAARAGAAVVVTLGDQGALLVLPDGTTDLVPGRPVDAVDTVGAGDAFCGHLAAALARGEALPSAVRVANVAASIAVTRRGSAAAPHLAEALAAA